MNITIAPTHRRVLRGLSFLAILIASPALGQQESTEREGATPAASAESSDEERNSIVANHSTLEREFERSMAGARLEGYWQMTGEAGLDDKGALTEPRKESYVISKVAKMSDDRWLVFARITFGDKDVNVPVPVRVVWAGDTAIITLDDVGVPLIGTYSARVMIHKGFYSGVWYSNVKNYGGVMAGKIMREDDKKQGDEEPSDAAGDD